MADNVTTDDLELALEQLAQEMGLSVVEYVESLGYASVSELTTATGSLQSQIDAITEITDNGAESLAEKIQAINAVISNEEGEIQAILTKILENKQLILDEVTRATGVEAGLQAQITANANTASNTATSLTALQTTVTNNKTAQNAINSDIEGRVSANEASLTTLNSDSTVAGSVDYKVEQERLRAVAQEQLNRTTSDANIATAKAEAIADANTHSDAGDAVLQSQIDALGTAGTSALATLNALATELDTTQASLGLGTDGSFTSVDGSDTTLEYIENVAGDADNLAKQVKKLARKTKQADQALDAKIDAEIVRATGVETSLQSQIDTLAGTGTGSLGDLEARVTANETKNVEQDGRLTALETSATNNSTVVDGIVADLEDGIDGNGDLVKGIKTRLTDVENGLATEIARATAREDAVLAEAKAYTDANTLKASSMDLCKIGNKFRLGLGLGAKVCDGGSGGSGDGLVI